MLNAYLRYQGYRKAPEASGIGFHPQWKGLGDDVAPYRSLFSHMRTGECRDKRAVLTDVMLDTLAVSTDCVRENAKLRISFRVYDISGEPVKRARVSFRMTPGDLKWRRAEETEDGYRYVLEERGIPVRYDMTRKEYIPLSGTCRVKGFFTFQSFAPYTSCTRQKSPFFFLPGKEDGRTAAAIF